VEELLFRLINTLGPIGVTVWMFYTVGSKFTAVLSRVNSQLDNLTKATQLLVYIVSQSSGIDIQKLQREVEAGWPTNPK